LCFGVSSIYKFKINLIFSQFFSFHQSISPISFFINIEIFMEPCTTKLLMAFSGFLKLRKEKAEFQVNFIAPLQYGRIFWPFIDRITNNGATGFGSVLAFRDLRNSAVQVQQTAIQLRLIPITDLPFHMAPLQAPLVTCSRVASLRIFVFFGILTGKRRRWAQLSDF